MMFIGVNHGQKSEILKTSRLQSVNYLVAERGTIIHRFITSKDAKVADEDFGHRP